MTNGNTDVILLVDYWPEDDVRKPAGSVLSVTTDKAMDMIETGVAKRAPKEK